jgi:hypothetical protein
MQYRMMWRQAARPGARAGIVAILLSGVMLLAPPAARAEDQQAPATQRPSAAGDTPPASAGPLTPIHRDATAGERPAAKAPAAVKAPAAPKPAAATAPAVATATPSAPKPETSAPKPPRNTAASAPSSVKPAAPAAGQAEKKPASSTTQAEKKPLPASGQAEKKPSPADRTAERERRHRHAAPETVQRRAPIYRDYAYRAQGQAPGWGYAPPSDYGEAEIAPAPYAYAPSWYYRDRSLAYGPYAYGPYSGMRGLRPMPW